MRNASIRPRRLLAAAALALASVAVAAPAPAEAASPPPLCLKEYHLMPFPGSIRAYGYKSCDDGEPVPLYVSLQRYDPASGFWHKVAEGVGEARFNCFGTGQRIYRHAQKPELTVTANCT